MKRAIGWVVALGAAYAVVGWLFARMTMTEGLVTPQGTPNLGVIATGVAYLGLRLFVRLVVPGAVAFVVAGRVIAWRRASVGRVHHGERQERKLPEA
jgi:hypothetical protein